MKETRLGTDPIHKLFFQYSLPSVAAMLFLGLNTIIDGLFVGRYIGAEALAAINLDMPFSSFLFALSVLIGIGSQSLIGRNLGAGQKAAANNAFTTALILVGSLSLFFTAAALLFPDNIAYLLGANEHLLPQVSLYIRCLGGFLPFVTVMMVLDYALKTIAMPVYAMLALVVAISSHIFFNWLFIVKLSWGIQGAAYATGIAFITAFIMAALPFFRKTTSLRPFAGTFDKQAAKDILYSGSSEGLSELGTGITTFLFNITLMKYAGEMGVAAFTVVSYLSFMGNNLLFGLSDGVGAIISYNYGSRQLQRVKKALKITFAAAFIIGLSIFIAIFFFSKEVLSLFFSEENQEVLTFAVYGAKLYAFAFLFNGLNIVISGYFTAIGSPKKALVISLSKGIVFIALGITLLPLLLGIEGIWLTVPLAEIITLGLSGFFIYWHSKGKTPLPNHPH